MAKINNWVANVEQYEDELTQAIALSVIPEEIVAMNGDPVAQLKALLAWFKTDFFRWMDKPACTGCQQCDTTQIVSQGYAKPTPEEVEGMAIHTEVYLCPVSRQVVRYPRYNQVIKLLETRSGRCGEWANCFTGLVIALGHEARYVVDWTDHVWTEAWIEAEQRWVHMDPCENAYDAPKMYERGWGKKLTYIIGISTKEVVDVTPRYIVNHSGNRIRRDKVPEDWLKASLAQLR